MVRFFCFIDVRTSFYLHSRTILIDSLATSHTLIWRRCLPILIFDVLASDFIVIKAGNFCFVSVFVLLSYPVLLVPFIGVLLRRLCLCLYLSFISSKWNNVWGIELYLF